MSRGRNEEKGWEVADELNVELGKRVAEIEQLKDEIERLKADLLLRDLKLAEAGQELERLREYESFGT